MNQRKKKKEAKKQALLNEIKAEVKAEVKAEAGRALWLTAMINAEAKLAASNAGKDTDRVTKALTVQRRNGKRRKGSWS